MCDTLAERDFLDEQNLSRSNFLPWAEFLSTSRFFSRIFRFFEQCSKQKMLKKRADQSLAQVGACVRGHVCGRDDVSWVSGRQHMRTRTRQHTSCIEAQGSRTVHGKREFELRPRPSYTYLRPGGPSFIFRPLPLTCRWSVVRRKKEPEAQPCLASKQIKCGGRERSWFRTGHLSGEADFHDQSAVHFTQSRTSCRVSYPPVWPWLSPRMRRSERGWPTSTTCWPVGQACITSTSGAISTLSYGAQRSADLAWAC